MTGSETAPSADGNSPADDVRRAAVVTGAASGIGRRIAHRFIAAGWQVIGVDVDEAGLGQVVEEAHDAALLDRAGSAPTGEVQAPPGEVVAWVGDVASRETHVQAAGRVASDRQLSAWVNCAGIAEAAPVHVATEEHFERIVSVNLGGVFWGCAVAVDAMAAGGAITNISSTQAVLGYDGYPAYAATKGGILSLTTQVAAEYAHRNIRCNAVLPGVIHTEMNDRILAEAEDPASLRQQWDRLCPIGRWGTPTDVAELVWFLSTSAAGFITGAHLRLDGGQTAVPPTWAG